MKQWNTKGHVDGVTLLVGLITGLIAYILSHYIARKQLSNQQPHEKTLRLWK